MKRFVGVAALVALMLGGHSAAAEARAACSMLLNGTIKDVYNNTVWTETNSVLGFGDTSDPTDCYNNQATPGVYNYGSYLCDVRKSGVTFNFVGDVYWSGLKTGTIYGPNSCRTDFGKNYYTTLGSGSVLNPGDYITSGAYTLIYQTDGNIVSYYNGSTPVWAGNCWPTCNSWGSAGAATMKTDGNFVVTNSATTEVWMSATTSSGAYLTYRPNGELVIVATNGNWLWSSIHGHS